MTEDYSSLESLGEFVVGTCSDMCPEKERIMRERERLLHPLELADDTEDSGLTTEECYTSRDGRQKPKSKVRHRANPDKTVKCFSRSAAGQKMPGPDDLRPAPVLIFTVNYLLREVASVVKNELDWAGRYDFVTDRFRAVRQDMIIQGLCVGDCIRLLEPMVWFHAYAGYRLCGQPINIFDPKMNTTHLHECLKRLLVLYSFQYDNSSKKSVYGKSPCGKNRHMIEALYILLNIMDPHALSHALQNECNLTCPCEKQPEQTAIQISLAWLRSDYVLVCRLIKKLPVLLACVAVSHLPNIRRHALRVMSTAYSSKVLRFPLSALQSILLWDTINAAETECRHYGIVVDDQGNSGPSVTFMKQSFNYEQRAIKPSKTEWLEKALSVCSLPELLSENKYGGLNV